MELVKGSSKIAILAWSLLYILLKEGKKTTFTHFFWKRHLGAKFDGHDDNNDVTMMVMMMKMVEQL